MPDTSISVVVPNRNDARFLARCIRSILEQDLPPDELIILDDESTDDSVSVIEHAIAGCNYARLVRNPVNLGATENSNKGLGLAIGRFVHFLGANDFVLPGFYATARKSLERYPNAGIWSAMVWTVDEDDNLLRIYPSPVLSLAGRFLSPDCVRRHIYRQGNWLTGQTTIYRRNALMELGGFNPRLKALTDLISAHVVASRYGAYFEPAPLAAMRLHDRSFLTETVRDEATFARVLELVASEGKRIEPELFSESMIDRTRQRLRFSSLRAVLAVEPAAARERMSREPERLVRLLAATPAAIPRRLVAGLLFLILRPFDVLPTLWYRFGGLFLIARVRGRANVEAASDVISRKE